VPSTRQPRLLQVAVLALGAIAFADMLCEGAAADWAAVYLHSTLRTSVAVAGLGYTVYSLAMVAVGLPGNRLNRKLLVERLLPFSASIASVGFAAALVTGQTAVVLLGFACLGAGLASIIPNVFSAAGRTPGVHAGSAVAAVSAFGWAGFILGPPVIGELASATSLRVALVVLPLLTSAVAISTARVPALRRQAPVPGE